MTTGNRSKERLFNGEIDNVDVELSSMCNLACYQCARTNKINRNQEIIEGSLSIDKFKELMPEFVIKRLKRIVINGTFGDPLMAKDFLKIWEYIISCNEEITLNCSTNGSLRSTKFFEELGTMTQHHKRSITFSIDGLSDTNHLYRVKANFDKIINNVKAFIGSGGNALWDCLLFAHNKHQVGEITKLAKDLGFKSIKFKITARKFDEKIIHLKPINKNHENKQINAIPEYVAIDCKSIKNRTVYLNAEGYFIPCCWLGFIQSNDQIPPDRPNQIRLSDRDAKTLGYRPSDKLCLDHCGVKISSYDGANIGEKQVFKEIVFK